MSAGVLRCKRCGASDLARSGMARGHQRCRCRACGSHFTDAPRRGKPPATKVLAALLYGMGFSMIGRVLGVSDAAVLKRVRAEGRVLAGAGGWGSRGRGGRDTAPPGKEPARLWVWRAYGLDQRCTVAWVLGGRDDEICRRLLDKVGTKGRAFVAGDWEGCHRVIPEGQLLTGKDLTFPIEQDNSNVRHCLARFRRRTKAVSKCRAMVDLPLRLLHHLQDPATFAGHTKRLAAIFGWNSPSEMSCMSASRRITCLCHRR